MLVVAFVIFMLVSLAWRSLLKSIARDPRINVEDLWVMTWLVLLVFMAVTGLWVVLTSQVGRLLVTALVVGILNETYHFVDDANQETENVWIPNEHPWPGQSMVKFPPRATRI